MYITRYIHSEYIVISNTEGSLKSHLITLFSVQHFMAIVIVMTIPFHNHFQKKLESSFNLVSLYFEHRECTFFEEIMNLNKVL